MTVIAYRDGVLAADTQATAGHSHRGHRVVKIAKKGPMLAAAAGSAVEAIQFLDWFRTGMKPENQPTMSKDGGGEGWLFTPDGWALHLLPNGWERFRSDYVAIGCGGDYAEGAMAFGASAEQAVRAALVHECLAGGEITVLRREG